MNYFWLVIFITLIFIQFFKTNNLCLFIYGLIIGFLCIGLFGLQEKTDKLKKELKYYEEFKKKWHDFNNHANK